MFKKVAETTVNALGYTLRPHATCVDEQGVAAKGYDVVAYYDEHAAFQGRESDTAEFNYALYWFKNGGNAIKFTASPGLYAPMCGGFCTMTCAEKKELVPGNPEHWCIHEKKLYFFSTQEDVQRFLESPDKFAAAAEENFKPLAQQFDTRRHGFHGPAGPKMGHS
eukprot:jgi/Pico_ML_1/52575/g3261.t2